VVQVAHLGPPGHNLLAVQRLGRDENAGRADTHALAYGIGPEGGKQRTEDAAGFPGTERGHVEFRNAASEREHAVAAADAEVPHDIGKSIRGDGQIRVAVGSYDILLADPDDCSMITAPLGEMPVDGLIREV
jgi:hypothetical protein